MHWGLQGAEPFLEWKGGKQLPAIAEFDSVGLRYGTGAEVLRDLDFRLAGAGFHFLTGPSGSNTPDRIAPPASRRIQTVHLNFDCPATELRNASVVQD